MAPLRTVADEDAIEERMEGAQVDKAKDPAFCVLESGEPLSSPNRCLF